MREPLRAFGSDRRSRRRRGAADKGFSLVELLVVLAVIALSAGAVMLALRDGSESRLEADAARLAALLDMARAESRAAGTVVRWVPRAVDDAQTPASDVDAPTDAEAQFHFTGLAGLTPMPTRWLDPAVTAQIVGGRFVLLGPEPILPEQRIVLSLAERRLELHSDGLSPFAVVTPP